MSDPSAGPDAAGAADLADLFQNAPCGYLVISSQGRIVMANATAAGWLAYRAEALAGMRLSEVMSIGGRMYWETHLGPLLRMQGFLDGVALDLLASDGRKIPAFASAAESRGPAGELLATRLALFKAAERRQYERSLVTSREAAQRAKDNLEAQEQLTQETLRREQESSKLREQFIAVLGHDLRNPLSAISGGARLLARETLSPRGAEILGLMQGSVTRMAGLIDDVMDFARGRLGGGFTLRRDAGEPLEPILLQVVDELLTSAPDRTVQTDISITAPVDCDRARLGQLVSNLLGNAITHGSADQPVRLVARTTDDQLEISVSNAGAPIPPAAMERLFQPFFRGEVRPSQQGLGLGLHIASEIAKAHGGLLTASSTEAETRFTFTMPLSPPVPGGAAKTGDDAHEEEPAQGR